MTSLLALLLGAGTLCEQRGDPHKLRQTQNAPEGGLRRAARAATVRGVPAVAKVEPLTTARALRGPFDYPAPEGVGVGSMLVVPFGHRDVVGVVIALAEQSERADELAAPRAGPRRTRCRPSSSSSRYGWIAPSTARRPRGLCRSCCRRPGGTRAKPRRGREARRATAAGERLTDAPARAAATTLPRFAGGDLPALRRLEARGLVALERRAGAPRARRTSPSARARAAAAADRRPGARARRDRGALARASPARAAAARRHRLGQDRGLPARRRTRRSRRGAACIVLVPEIGLTPQIVSRFVDALRRHRRGPALQALRRRAPRRVDAAAQRRGARLRRPALGRLRADRADLGLVVVDEEHDASYKHEGDPRYDARHVAARRARQAGAVLLAGSATPRPESVHALRARCACPRASTARRCRRCEIVDMRERRARAAPAHARRARRRAQGDRAAQPPRLVELPRPAARAGTRGSARTATSRSSCTARDGTLACHHCGHRERVPRALPRRAAR